MFRNLIFRGKLFRFDEMEAAIPENREFQELSEIRVIRMAPFLRPLIRVKTPFLKENCLVCILTRIALRAVE